jgi:hypothetical protein
MPGSMIKILDDFHSGKSVKETATEHSIPPLEVEEIIRFAMQIADRVRDPWTD